MGRTPTRRTRTPVAQYIADQPAEVRPALRTLRRELRTALPRADEVISYGVPAYKVEGRLVLGFGAARTRCSIYVMSPAVLRGFTKALKHYELTKGAIHFFPEHPLPVSLLRKLVKASLAENAGTHTRRR